jgi:hypothetical protein
VSTLHLERVRASEKTLKALIVCFAPYLCHVSLKGVASVSDDVIASLGSLHDKSLKSLNVMHCFRVSDESLTQIALRCALLEDLNVSDTSQYGTTDATVAAACRCPRLRHFEAADLGLVTDSSLVTALTLPHLETLNVSGCKRVTDGMFRRIAAFAAHGSPNTGTNMTPTSPLKTIRLSTCDISDEGIFGLVRAARSITTLSLAHCVRVSDAALLDAIRCSGGSFTNLDFSGTGVGDVVVQAALKTCGQLRVLRLALCINVTAAIFPSLVSDGRNLRLLDLTGAGGNAGHNGAHMLRGAALREFALLSQMQGCTVLAEYHEKGPARQPKQGNAARTVQQGRSRRASTAVSIASSTESSWLPVVQARSLQGNHAVKQAAADSATDVADDDLF